MNGRRQVGPVGRGDASAHGAGGSDSLRLPGGAAGSGLEARVAVLAQRYDAGLGRSLGRVGEERLGRALKERGSGRGKEKWAVGLGCWVGFLGFGFGFIFLFLSSFLFQTPLKSL